MNAEAQCVLRSDSGAPVPLRGVKVTGRLEGFLFQLTVEQHYRNDSGQNIEAEYTFPVPCRAVLLGLQLEIGSRSLEAVAVRKRQARERCEKAIDEGDSAVLLEQAGDGLYTVSLGNLLAGEEAVIRYRYAELLDRKGDEVRLAIPTVIAPRYGTPASAGLAPHQAPHVDLLADYPFELTVDLVGAMASAAISSPSHSVQVAQAAQGKRVTLGQGARLDRDFILTLKGDATRQSTLLARDRWAGRKSGADAFVSLVSLDPALDSRRGAPLALKLLVDCSGSMAGDSIDCTRRALLTVLDRLQPADRVSLTRFGSKVVQETEGLVPAKGRALAGLRRLVGALNADLGGTELRQALEAAVAISTDSPEPPRFILPIRRALGPPLEIPIGEVSIKDILLITDGEIWSVPELVEAAARFGHRLFVVAVGAAPVETLARRVSETTGGACEFVSRNEDAAAAILRMFARLREAPIWLTGVRWPGQPVWEGPLPKAVFSGDTLHLWAGFSQAPAGDVVVCLDGPAGHRELRAALDPVIADGAAADLLPRVAASCRLGTLEGEQAAELAERYQLASAHTSLVVVKARSAEENGLPVLAQVPQMLAAGYGAFGSVGREYDAVELACRVPAFMLYKPVAQRLLQSAPCQSSPATADSLDAVDVVRMALRMPASAMPSALPASLIEGLTDIAGRTGLSLEQVIQVLVALLAAGPAGDGLSDDERERLRGTVPGDRELREVRRSVGRLIRQVWGKAWTEVAHSPDTPDQPAPWPT